MPVLFLPPHTRNLTRQCKPRGLHCGFAFAARPSESDSRSEAFSSGERANSRHRRDSRVSGCSCAQRTIGFAYPARSDAAKTIQYCFCQGKPKARSRQSRVYRGDRRRLCDGVFSGSSLTITGRRACKFSLQARFPCFDLIFHDIHPNRRLDIWSFRAVPFQPNSDFGWKYICQVSNESLYLLT